MQGYKRKRGLSWELTISDGFDENGKRVRYTRTLKPVFKNDKLVALLANEADDALRDFIIEIQGRCYAGQMTVGQYLDYWYNTFIDPEKVPEKAKSYAKKTKEWYKMNIDKHLKPELGRILLRELNAHDIKKALNNIAAKTGNEKASIEGVFRTLRAALEIAKGTYITSNPAKDKAARPPRATKREILNKHKVLDIDEAAHFLVITKKIFLEAPEYDKYKRFVLYAIYQTALLQALRQGELLGLKIEDLNFNDKIIRVKEQLNNDNDDEDASDNKANKKKKETNKKNKDRKDLKTESSYREIRMTQMVAEILQELFQYREIAKKKAGDKWKEHSFVFTLDDGRPLCAKSLTRWHLKRDLEAANLPMIRFHDLRGSSASLLAELGEDPWTIANICGHSAPQVAQDHYIHNRVSRQDNAMQKLDQIFREKLEKTAEN
jgi:integrase